MDLPRLTFNGRVRVDPATGNNLPCNFHPNEPIDKGWNFHGTGEFSLLDCRVTSALDSNGVQPLRDTIINSAVISNINGPHAKAVDLDVQLMITTVYGLTLAVIGVDGEILVQGKVKPFVLGQDMWRRDVSDDATCLAMDFCLSAKSASVIADLTWGEVSRSHVLQKLKHISDQRGGMLAISMTVYSYISWSPYNFTLGHVIGTIGPLTLNEPLLIPGQRKLSYVGVPRTGLYLHNSSNDSNHDTLMYNSPFQISHDFLRLTVDFSNSISFDLHGRFRNIGQLWLGVQDERKCIHLIGKPIPYLENDWVHNGCIYDHILSEDIYNHLLSSPLYVYRATRSINVLTICSHTSISLQLMLKETPKYIRPMSDYISRLEYKQSMTVELKVTQYGWPIKNQKVHIIESIPAAPQGGIVPFPQISSTDEQGIATVVFQVVRKIPQLRKCSYPQTPCNRLELPIEGQLYNFQYYVSDTFDNKGTIQPANIVQPDNFIALIAFSYFKEPLIPNWVDNIEPIFKQYDRLFPVMRHIVNLGDYSDVTTTRNLHMIDYSMGLDINHPSYMPVTRDLSPSKKTMIQKWLRQKPKPIYSFQNKFTHLASKGIVPMCIHPNVSRELSRHISISPFIPSRCLKCEVEIESDDTYFQQLFTQINPPRICNNDRPLIQEFGVKVAAQSELCTLQQLKQQLQTAIQLEFFTIPLYLTSLFSIVDGCNHEISQIIRSVVKQEMQHMTQAANILIAIGGRPIIDSSAVAPSYPAKGLPGGVLPNLVITLERFSKQHVYKVFMGVEVPHNISVDTESPIVFNNTIGQFYKEIRDCIDFLGDDIFIPSLVHKQITWPWVEPSVGFGAGTRIVSDTHSAQRAIDEIIEQGEGAGPFDPTEKHIPFSEHNIAHFYKFEEIVCGRHLVNYHGSYCYSGLPIPHDPLGVWPMQSNPSKHKVKPNTNCYTQAKAFHGTYRALLRSLQELFDGDRRGIKDTIVIMESLGVHARQVMNTKSSPNEESSCGPVWDYDWD